MIFLQFFINKARNYLQGEIRSAVFQGALFMVYFKIDASWLFCNNLETVILQSTMNLTNGACTYLKRSVITKLIFQFCSYCHPHQRKRKHAKWLNLRNMKALLDKLFPTDSKNVAVWEKCICIKYLVRSSFTTPQSLESLSNICKPVTFFNPN